MRLSAGMDISYHSYKSAPPDHEKYEYIATVIGMEDVINSTINRIGHGDRIHMRLLRNKRTRNEILSRADFHNDGIMAICAKIEKKRSLTEMIIKSGKNHPSGKVWRAIDYSLLYHLKPTIAEYLAAYKHEVADVVFECDSDCLSLIKDGRLRHTRPGRAHMLADIVAWGNSHGAFLGGVVEMDLVDLMRHQLGKMFR